MREGHRMEDENEWPYLVSEDRHYYRYDSGSPKTPERPKSNEQKIHDILDNMNLTPTKHMKLFKKTMEFLNAPDCIALNVEGGYGEYSFIFTQENEYIKTTHEFIYNPEFGDFSRIFRDCYTSHDHKNLLKSQRFQNMIRSTGLEFVECTGGYECKYLRADDEFRLTGKIDLGIHLKAGSKRRRYALDLDKMELSKDYSEYDTNNRPTLEFY